MLLTSWQADDNIKNHRQQLPHKSVQLVIKPHFSDAYILAIHNRARQIQMLRKYRKNKQILLGGVLVNSYFVFSQFWI